MSSLRPAARSSPSPAGPSARSGGRTVARGPGPLPGDPPASSLRPAEPSELRPGARSATPAPVTPRAYSCRCGRPVFFGNSECLACHTPLGYDAERGRLLPLDLVVQAPAAAGDGDDPSSARWREAGAPRDAPLYRRCSNLDTAAGCNWLVADDDAHADALGTAQPLCRCCRLTRTLPDLSLENSELWWHRIETAKRRLVSSLVGLKLPVASKAEDPARGLAFDLLRAMPGGLPVVTGHAEGVITLDVEEADDAWREQRRAVLMEPYRTLLGHLRHETGHYYWQRLVEHSHWLGPWRALFGDERRDYLAALNKHYEQGPAPQWGQRYVSAYASCHPWEDWAETWAHYLHMVDTLDTARSFGLDGERVQLDYERFGSDAVAGSGDPKAGEFLQLLNSWMELAGVLNELSRSMGVPDFYPFVLSRTAVRKLHLVHRIITTASQLDAQPAQAGPGLAAKDTARAAGPLAEVRQY
jgi:hypothetical protein